MSQRPQALRQATLARSLREDATYIVDTSREPWATEMAELMSRLSPDDREALLRIARAMAEASAAQEAV